VLQKRAGIWGNFRAVLLDGKPSGVAPDEYRFTCREQAGRVYNKPFSRLRRKFRFKSVWFYGAEVGLPCNTEAGRKLYWQNRSEITRDFAPHASIRLFRT
jgi:hypothetical protein